MDYLLIFHPVADKEYSEAYKWYEERLEGLGDRFLRAIEEQLARIISKPLLFSKKKGAFREAKTDTFPYILYLRSWRKEKLYLFLQSITAVETLRKNIGKNNIPLRVLPILSTDNKIFFLCASRGEKL